MKRAITEIKSAQVLSDEYLEGLQGRLLRARMTRGKVDVRLSDVEYLLSEVICVRNALSRLGRRDRANSRRNRSVSAPRPRRIGRKR